MKYKVSNLFKDNFKIYIVLPGILLALPFLMKILTVTHLPIVMLLDRYVGFFYFESLIVFIVILIYVLKTKEKILNIALVFNLAIFFLLLFFLIHYWKFEINILKSGDVSGYIQEQAKLKTFWYEVYEKISFDSRVHGYLGIIMGSICAYITLLGSYSNLKEGIINDMKAILPTITLLSVIVSIAIFGIENKEFFFSFRYIFSIGMLLFVPLVFIFGCLSSVSLQNRKGKNYIVLFISLLIAFCIGFVYGDLMIPLTRRPIPGTEKFVSFPSTYTLLCFTSLFIGIILYLLSNPNSRLSKSVKRLFDVL